MYTLKSLIIDDIIDDTLKAESDPHKTSRHWYIFRHSYCITWDRQGERKVLLRTRGKKRVNRLVLTFEMFNELMVIRQVVGRINEQYQLKENEGKQRDGKVLQNISP